VVSSLVAVARTRLKGTPVQRWRLTSVLYRRYVLYRSRALPGSPTTVIVEFRGIDLEIERGDITILPTLLTGEYEKDELDALLSRVRQCSTFVDVGANVGVYSVLGARAVGGTGHVVAAEPNPSARRLLEANVERNHAERVQVVPFAIADVEGDLAWERTPYHGTGRLARAERQGGETVRATTLDALTRDLGLTLVGGAVKVDVEGFEPRVIEGGVNVIRRARPVLLVEVCGESSAASGVSWDRALEVIGGAYGSISVFGPLEQLSRRGEVGAVLSAVVADGRQHNVLLVDDP
jgi:FkbM family methyltransferase